MVTAALDKKLKSAQKNADYQRVRYWDIRLKVVRYLGCFCQCGEYQISQLQIHHDDPLLWSVKRPGAPCGPRSGEARIREWRAIVNGKSKATLSCKICHPEILHNGNTNGLKKV